MTIDEQLRWWLADPSAIPALVPWGPAEATFDQMMIAWALIWQKQHGVVGDARALGYLIAGSIVQSPGSRAYGWEQIVRQIVAAEETA